MVNTYIVITWLRDFSFIIWVICSLLCSRNHIESLFLPRLQLPSFQYNSLESPRVPLTALPETLHFPCISPWGSGSCSKGGPPGQWHDVAITVALWWLRRTWHRDSDSTGVKSLASLFYLYNLGYTRPLLICEQQQCYYLLRRCVVQNKGP